MAAVTILIIIFVVFLLFTYFYHMYKDWRKNKKKFSWPPEVLPCPDYWVNKGNGVCENPFGLGLSCDGTFKGGACTQANFGTMPGCSNPNSGACLQAKAGWAKKTQNPWFGVSKSCRKNPANCYVPA